MKYKVIESVVGPLTLVANDESLVAILWEDDSPGRVKLGVMQEDGENNILQKAELELNEYFANKRTTFSVPFSFAGTSFQQDVWQALQGIPYGTTVTYKDIAEKIGRPKAVRAVGAAIGKNPISIIVACHRVIASNGNLQGFAGGLHRKKILLELEKNK